MVALTSLFVQAGNGAVFAMVPLVQRRVSGQIAGIAGSYGNIGGIAFSSLLYFTADKAHPAGDTRLLFLASASAAAAMAVLCRWLPALDHRTGRPEAPAGAVAVPAREELWRRTRAPDRTTPG